MTITTVLLDAGGVLLDEAEMESSRAEATARFLSRYVAEYSVDRYWDDVEEAVQAFVPDTYRYVFRKHLDADPVGAEAAYAFFRDEWFPTRPPLRLMAGIESELHTLARQFKLGIAGQYGVELLKLLEGCELLECFAWGFTQDDFALTKPDPRYLQQIMEACGVTPHECIVVGDRIDKDIIPAKQLRMRTIRIRVGLHRSQRPRTPLEVPDIELDSAAGLADAAVRLASANP